MAVHRQKAQADYRDMYPFNLLMDVLNDDAEVQKVYLSGLDDVLGELNKTDRDILKARYIDGMGLDAYARKQGLSEEDARAALDKVIEWLREDHQKQRYIAVSGAVYSDLTRDIQSARSLLETVREELYAAPAAPAVAPPAAPAGILLEEAMPILSSRFYNSLRRAGFQTLNEVAELSASQVLKIRGIHAMGLEEIQQAMEKFGLALAEEPAPYAGASE